MVRHRIKKPGMKSAWKAAVITGAMILCLTMILGLFNLFEFKIYSMWTVLLIYVGFLLLIFGVSKLQRKRKAFFLTFFLGTTALAFLATMDMSGYFGETDISLMTGGTFIFLGVIVLLSLIILLSIRSLRNRRRSYQSFSFILFNLGALGIAAKHLIMPGLHCYACPWATAGCPIGLLQNWIIMGQIPYYLIGTSVAIFTLFGRAFCGWACPFGFLHDIISMITDVKYKKSNLKNILGKGNSDRPAILTYVTRSFVLIVLVVGAWRFAETWFCKVCPAGFIEAALPYRLNHSVAPDPLFVFRVVIFFSLIIIALIISRFWCRYFCPLGHLAGHFNGVSMLQLNLDEEKCNGCGLCRKGCPMELDPESFLKKNPDGRGRPLSHLKRLVNKEQSNCILCGECVENCKNGALTISFLRTPDIFGGAELAHDIKTKVFGGTRHAKGETRAAYGGEATMDRDYGGSDDLGPEEPHMAYRPKAAVARAPAAFQAPPQKKRDIYSWPFPVTIYVFYKSYSELPRNLELLRTNPDYQVYYYGIYEEDKYLNFYMRHYKGHIDTPVIVVNGQVYLGPIEDNNEILHFVEEVQSTYSDIYIYCNCDDCMSVCDSEQFSRAVGNMVLSRGEQYPLRTFKVYSPGAILSLCSPGAIYALYGENRQDEHRLSEHIRYKVKDYSEKELQLFKDIPVTTMELYLKKDNDLSNELLNVISYASYHSGGKLRFTITEWNKDIPSININGNELPLHNYPTSYYTLLTMIRKYGKI